MADAGLGAVRPALAYKAERGQTTLTVADRFFPSSKLHHNCGGTLAGKKLAKILTCEMCGEEVDRDHNAAKNLRDWPEILASPGAVGASAMSPGLPQGGPGGGSDGRATGHRARLRKTSTSSRPRPVRREPRPAPGRRRNPARGASEWCSPILAQV